MSSSNSFDLSSNSGAANIPTLKTADNRLAKTRSFAAWASNSFVGMCRDVSGCLSTKMLQGANQSSRIGYTQEQSDTGDGLLLDLLHDLLCSISTGSDTNESL